MWQNLKKEINKIYAVSYNKFNETHLKEFVE